MNPAMAATPAGPPAALAGKRPGDMNTFTGSNGVVRQISSDGTISGRGSNIQGNGYMPGDTAGFSRTLNIPNPATSSGTAAGVANPASGQAMPASQPATYTTQPLARPQPDQSVPTVALTRPTPNPAGQRAAILDPRSMGSEFIRRAENAGMDARRMARSSKGMYTRAQLEAAGAAAATERNFWLDQAASVGNNAEARFQRAMDLQSQEGQTNANNAAAFQRTLSDNNARLQGEQMQQQGAMDRTLVDLQRPQQPITLGDGTLAKLGADGQLVPYQLPDGSVARGVQNPARDYAGEARIRALGQADASVLRNEAMSAEARAAQLAQNQARYGGGGGRTVVRTGTVDGRRVVQYSDGSIEEAS